MEISLNIPRGHRQEQFLDYLNSALRERFLTSCGSVAVTAEGDLQIWVQGTFALHGRQIEMKWQVTKDPSGSLSKLSVQAVDPSVPENDWHTAVYEFVTSVLATTVAEKQQKFFRRTLFYYIGPQLDGEYWLPGYRFAPAYPGDADQYLINAERVVCIDQNIWAIDEDHASVLAEERARRNSARLSLLLNVGLYRHDHEKRWVLPILDGKLASESSRFQLGFTHPSLFLKDMPKKGALCNLGSYKGSLAARYRIMGQLESLPGEARKILRGVDNAEPLVSDAFDRGSRLYQVACVCGRIFPSVGLAYRVAAVDAISKADKDCKSFSDFMRKHVTSQSEIDGILSYLYGNARSGHFHEGVFPMGEFAPSQGMAPLMDEERLGRDSLHRTCYELTREAIVNWLTKMVPDKPDSDAEDQG
jgi:hypothetical protein